MNAKESKSLFKGNEPTIWRLRDEVEKIIGIELYSDAVPNYVNEALKLNQNQIDTEHLLLGLIRKGRSTAVRVLRRLDVNLEDLEIKVIGMINKPTVSSDVEQPLAFTNAAKQILQYAAEEARQVKSDYVCDEHVLLGLIREKKGIAAKALANFGVTLEKVRELLDPRPMLKFQHRNRQLSPNNIDKAIRDLVYLLNEAPFLETSSSCSGHPDYYRSLMPTDEWRDGWITVDVIGDIGPVWDFLEFVRARLDNTHGLELSRNAKSDKETPHVNRTRVYRTLALFKQVDGEALYTSAVPILTTYFSSLIGLHIAFDKLPLMWNIILRITQEFISSSETLPYIETPEAGGETFVNLFKSAPHIQDIVAYNNQSRSRGGADIYFLWNRASVQWGWDFINYLKTRLEDEPDKPRINFRTSFTIIPIVKRDNLQRTREDHLKIWKLIELAAREYIQGDLV